MQKMFGLILVIASLFVGVYFGFFWAFIGGIVQIIKEVTSGDFGIMGIGFGVLKVMFATVIGYISFFVTLLMGVAMMQDQHLKISSLKEGVFIYVMQHKKTALRQSWDSSFRNHCEITNQQNLKYLIKSEDSKLLVIHRPNPSITPFSQLSKRLQEKLR